MRSGSTTTAFRPEGDDEIAGKELRTGKVLERPMGIRKYAAPVAGAALFTPLNGVIAAIVVLVLVLAFIIWRRRNRRKNRGNSVYLFH